MEGMFDNTRQNPPIKDENKNLKAELKISRIEKISYKRVQNKREAQDNKEVVNAIAEACHALSKEEV